MPLFGKKKSVTSVDGVTQQSEGAVPPTAPKLTKMGSLKKQGSMKASGAPIGA
jgi:hypothetical protein